MTKNTHFVRRLIIEKGYTTQSTILKLEICIAGIQKQGGVSHIFDLGPSFYFMQS